MPTREERRIELEQIFKRDPHGGLNVIVNLYREDVGVDPPVGMLVVQSMIPAILDAEFPESGGASQGPTG